MFLAERQPQAWRPGPGGPGLGTAMKLGLSRRRRRRPAINFHWIVEINHK